LVLLLLLLELKGELLLLLLNSLLKGRGGNGL